MSASEGERAGPHPAATVVVLRPGAAAGQAPEVLLLKRHARAGFMANVWVFPGGRVDEADFATPDPYRAAAVRETAEEAGVTLTGSLAFCAHWITPASEKRRFDTRFFLTHVPAGTDARPDTTEVTEALWLGAADALARHHAGELPLAPPTWVTLHALAPHAHIEAATAWAEAQRPEPLCPSLELVEGKVRVVSGRHMLVLDAGRWVLVGA